jgi:hypothetical protein
MPKISYNNEVRHLYMIVIATQNMVRCNSLYTIYHHPQDVMTYWCEIGGVFYVVVELLKFDIPFDQLKDSRDLVGWGLKHGPNLIKKEVDIVMAKYPDFKGFFQAMMIIKLTLEKHQKYDKIFELSSMIISVLKEDKGYYREKKFNQSLERNQKAGPSEDHGQDGEKSLEI